MAATGPAPARLRLSKDDLGWIVDALGDLTDGSSLDPVEQREVEDLSLRIQTYLRNK
jgi:hypothetical protein